eukprot:5293746-Pleurochrysis_carterae.AAC.4
MRAVPSLNRARRRSSGSPSELAPDSPSLERVRQRGLLPKLVEGLGACYFADVRMLRYFVKNAPEMLLLPWEMMRRFGVVTRREASKTVYTCASECIHKHTRAHARARIPAHAH